MAAVPCSSTNNRPQMQFSGMKCEGLSVCGKEDRYQNLSGRVKLPYKQLELLILSI